MKRKSSVLSAILLLGLGAMGQALAQSEGLDVTLEVIDDVSEVDGVVLRLEDESNRDVGGRDERTSDGRESDREQDRERDQQLERDSLKRDADDERDERRESDVEDRELETDRETDVVEEEIL